MQDKDTANQEKQNKEEEIPSFPTIDTSIPPPKSVYERDKIQYVKDNSKRERILIFLQAAICVTGFAGIGFAIWQAESARQDISNMFSMADLFYKSSQKFSQDSLTETRKSVEQTERLVNIWGESVNIQKLSDMAQIEIRGTLTTKISENDEIIFQVTVKNVGRTTATNVCVGGGVQTPPKEWKCVPLGNVHFNSKDSIVELAPGQEKSKVFHPVKGQERISKLTSSMLSSKELCIVAYVVGEYTDSLGRKHSIPQQIYYYDVGLGFVAQCEKADSIKEIYGLP